MLRKGPKLTSPRAWKSDLMKEKYAVITKIPFLLKELRPLGNTVLHLNIKCVIQNLLVLTDSTRVLTLPWAVRRYKIVMP
jgi:hypothetical protein